MKFRIVIVALATLVIAFFGTSEIVLAGKYLSYVEKTSKNINEYINEENYLNTENVEKIEKLCEYWKKKENILCFMVIHNDILDLGKSLEECKASLKVENYDDYKKNLELVIHFSEDYKHIFSLSAQNIF